MHAHTCAVYKAECVCMDVDTAVWCGMAQSEYRCGCDECWWHRQKEKKRDKLQTEPYQNIIRAVSKKHRADMTFLYVATPRHSRHTWL